MKDNEFISGSLQENIITLLCFSDEAAPQIVGCLDINLIESSVYKEIVRRAVSYYNEFKEAPKQHLPDLMEELLSGEDDTSDLYIQILENMYDKKDEINEKYILGQLSRFIGSKELRNGIVSIMEMSQAGDLDGAYNALDDIKRKQLKTFDSGTWLGDLENFNPHEVRKLIKSGIKELDDIGICPAIGEMILYMGGRGTGKSWLLTHIGSNCLRQRKKVLHVTLEMSEKKVQLRYLQNWFALSKRKAHGALPIFEKDEFGKIASIDFEELPDVKSYFDEDIKEYLQKKMKEITYNKLLIKSFPSGTLTISKLKAYLSMLEYTENFLPDVILFDYPDLMQISSSNLRIETGRIYIELSGIAEERNLAMVAVTQPNREGEKLKEIKNSKAVMSKTNIGEDISKASTVENFVTLNQTKLEKKLGLLRFYVDKGRDDRSGDIVVAASNLSYGQYCLDSAFMGNEYWDIVDTMEGDVD